MLSLKKLYKGVKKTVVALVEDEQSPVMEYLESLDDRTKKKMKRLMMRIADRGILLGTELFNHLGNHIYEFKVHKPRAARIFCFFDGYLIICTHGKDKPGKRQLKIEVQKVMQKRQYYKQGVHNGHRS